MLFFQSKLDGSDDFGSGQDAPGPARIFFHLPRQKLPRRKLLLIPNFLNPVELDLAVIKVALKIKNETLDRSRPGAKGGIRADAGDARQQSATGLQNRRVDAICWNHLRPALDIRGGEPETPSSLMSARHHSGDEMSAAEELVGPPDFAAGDELADPAAADRDPVQFDRVHHSDFETVFGAPAREIRQPASFPFSKTKIPPHPNLLRLDAIRKIALNKIFRFEIRESPIEFLDDDGVYPAVAQQADLVFPRQDQLRRPLGRQELERVRLERDDDRPPASISRFLDDRPQELSVPPMQSIEASQRQDRPRNRQVPALDMTKDFHNC